MEEKKKGAKKGCVVTQCGGASRAQRREQGTAAQAGPVTALGLLQGERRSWCSSEASRGVGDRTRQHGAGTTEMRRSGRSLTSWMNP